MSKSLSTAVLRLRIDPALKQDADDIARAMGLSLSDAVRMFLIRFVSDRRFPFVPEVPNKETEEAMLAGKRGELTTANSVDEYFAELEK